MFGIEPPLVVANGAEAIDHGRYDAQQYDDDMTIGDAFRRGEDVFDDGDEEERTENPNDEIEGLWAFGAFRRWNLVVRRIVPNKRIMRLRSFILSHCPNFLFVPSS